MSCRSNHGSSAMTSYARAASGLSDVQTLHMFHRMMNEGREREVEAPTSQAVSNWRRDTINAVRDNSNISEGQRERIVQRLEALPSDFVPDGPTFHAWNRIRSSAWHARQALNKVYQQLAERGGVEVEYLAARSETYQKTGDAARWRPPARFMERLGREFPDQIDLGLIPQDNRTLYALSRLLEENPASPSVETSSPPSNIIPVDRPQAEALPDSTPRPAAAPTQVEAMPAVAPPAPAQPARCTNCGQFTGASGHNCPADVVLQIGRNRGQPLGDLLETPRGVSYLNWLADSGRNVTYNQGRENAINYSDLARQILAGRQELANQTEATPAPVVVSPPPAPVETPVPVAVPPASPAPVETPTTPRLPRQWARAARRIRQTLSAQEQAQLQAAQEAQVQEVARPRQEVAQAPKLSGPEGQATYDSWVTEVRTARAAGGGPPYETERVLGDAATSFGVELEFKGADADAVARKLYQMGLAGHPQMVAYHHSCPDCQGKWKVERDGSVTERRNNQNIGGEVVAPVLQDTPAHWEQLKQVADTIKELGGHCDQNTGQHVHISTADYDNQGSKYRNLALEVAAHEDLLYRMSAPDQQHHRGLLRTDRPEYHYAQPIAPRVQQFLTKPAPALRTLLRAMRVQEIAHDRVPWAHYMSLNMQHVNEAEAGKSRVEFRTFNGTIDPVQIQTNVRLSAGLVHTAGAVERGSEPEQRGLGWHRHSQTEEEDSQQIRSLIDRLHLSESGAKAMLDTFLRGRWQYQTRAELQQAS